MKLLTKMLALSAFLMVAACGSDATVEEVCDHACGCLDEGGDPDAKCVGLCESSTEDNASQSCLNCLADATCTELAGDEPCAAECGDAE
jgi:hypothetical protein